MNERDWTLLNAYADGELEQREMAVLSARLAREPTLAAELRRIKALKDRLVEFRVEQEHAARRTSATWLSSSSLALAAALLIAALIGFAAIDRQSAPSTVAAPSALAMHESFAARSYAKGALPILFVEPDGIAPPDLSGSNLRLVDAQSSSGYGTEVVGYHYRGPRGCRVTLVIGRSVQLPDDIALAHQWTVHDYTLMLVADGMDPQRFAAIAAFAAAATRGSDPTDAFRIALEETTAAARPCA